ncbi:hypothetical protein, variant [Capsaspora owczarzaki ATCC 30864]|nr:hypothetical protein, variant [Capsaspora owczarzaki ATCC 30864]
MTERQRELYDKVKNARDYLEVRCVEIGDTEAQIIAEALKVNTTATSLDLSENQIGDAGALAIAEALKVNKTLFWLSLNENQIGEAGAQAIAEALKVNTRLAYLDLGLNQIGVAGAQIIAEALKVNKTLSSLSLIDNQIGGAGAQAIADTLKVNETVTSLHLQENQIGDVGAHAIAEALKVNKTLSWLDLDINEIGDVGAHAIAEALKANTAVTALHLEENQIGSTGAQEIAEALKVNTRLAFLDVHLNCIGNAGLQAFDEARHVNRILKTLLIDKQINPLAFSFFPRMSTAEDLHNVFHLLTSEPAVEDQSAALPALPTEIAELIMDKAHYWQGVQHTKREWFHVDTPDRVLKVIVPQGNSIRVKAIQVFRDWRKRPDNTGDCVFDLTVQDEQGDVQYEWAVHPTVVDSNLELVIILPANHPVIRQMREGWQVQVRASKSAQDVQFESLYVGYV